MSLAKLAKYAEGFAIILMEDTIAGGWQGIEFKDTASKYEQWKRSHPQETTSPEGRRPSRIVNI